MVAISVNESPSSAVWSRLMDVMTANSNSCSVKKFVESCPPPTPLIVARGVPADAIIVDAASVRAAPACRNRRRST